MYIVVLEWMKTFREVLQKIIPGVPKVFSARNEKVS
jgi:hypothetical protein